MDETPSALPEVLRQFRLMRTFLEPPARMRGWERELYPIRVTMFMVAVFIFAAQAALLWLLGEMATGNLVAFVALPLLGGTLVLLWAGWPRLAIALGMTLASGVQLLILVTYGSSTGAWLFSISIALAAYQVHAPEDWPQRLLPATYASVGTLFPFVFPDLRPLRDPGEFALHVMFAVSVLGTLYAVFVVSSHAAMVRDHVRAEVSRERDRADALLRNILPAAIIRRLHTRPGVIADGFDQATVVFCDLVGFTPLSARMKSDEIVLLLNEIFSAFDDLAARHGLEKIKTIGDAYMVVSGVPEPRSDHAAAAVRMALHMRAAVAACAARTGHSLEVRIGVHSGPLVAGVIGVHKFAYDLWGDTVNTASRMESHGAPGSVHISDATRALLPPAFDLEERGAIAIKGKGDMRTWFVRGET